jgi:hypothetical protein
MPRFRGDKIRMMQEELRNAMAEAAGDDEKISAGQHTLLPAGALLPCKPVARGNDPPGH